MNCPMCKKENITERVIKHTPELKGENLTIYSNGYLCDECDFTWTSDEQMAELRHKAADEYRRIHGLLTSQDIKQMRSSLEMSQDEFAQYVGVGITSIKRYESYQIQDLFIDRLIRQKMNL
jgi:putative zinc finger/helix-turn-helix YgiT family protein